MTEDRFEHVSYCNSLSFTVDHWEKDGLVLQGTTPGCGCCSDRVLVTEQEDILDYLVYHAKVKQESADWYRNAARLVGLYGTACIERHLTNLDEAFQILRKVRDLVLDRDLPYLRKDIQAAGSRSEAIRLGFTRFLECYAALDTVGKEIGQSLDSYSMDRIAEWLAELYASRETVEEFLS